MNSKLKYNVLQDYMQQFDVVCLTETKCDAIEETKIVGFEYFIMPKKLETQILGYSQYLCVYKRTHITSLYNY